MGDDSFPWMKLYPSDFRGSAKVQAMSGEEVGYYFLLLLQVWEEGSVPDDSDQLWTICKTTPDKMRRAWPKIRPCMMDHPDREGHLTNARVEEELAKARERRRRAKAAWEASAESRGESGTHERDGGAGRSSGTVERDAERGGGASLARSDTSVASEALEATDVQSDSSDSLPMVEKSDGEDAVVETSREKENRWGDTVTACREHLWLSDQPPDGRSIGQELSVAKQLTDRWNLDPPEVAEAVEGFASLRERGFWEGWIERDEPAKLLALNRTPEDEHGIPVVVRCLHEMRKGEPASRGEGGMERLEVSA